MQRVLSTLKVKKKAVEELTAPGTIRESPLYKPLAPDSPRRYTRQSSVHRAIVGSPPPEDEEILEARTTMTTASSSNRGIEQKSIEKPAKIERGKRVVLMKSISSIIGGKRKFFCLPFWFSEKSKTHIYFR